MAFKRRVLIRTVLLGAVLAALAPTVQAAPTGEWDRCIQKLCTSTSQSDCWIKAAAAMCDRDQIQCKELPDHAPAKVLRHVGKRWEVVTQYGKGWVSDRMMMINGSMCPALDQ